MSKKIKYELKDGSSAVKQEPEQPVFKTEETLKTEARERLEEQARLESQKAPVSERRKKIDNYMFHYKWHTIAIIAGAVLLVFFLRDTLFRVKPDLTLVVATSRFITQGESDALQAALEALAGDLNGDGKVVVGLDTIYLPISSFFGHDDDDAQPDDSMVNFSGMNDAELIQASSMKLMAIVSASTDPLYLLDDDLYSYLMTMSGPLPLGENGELPPQDGSVELEPDYMVFDPLDDISASYGYFNDRVAIKDTVLASEPGFEYLGDAAFSIRPAYGSNEKYMAYHAYCSDLLRRLAK